MPKNFRRKKRTGPACHKFRINKGKNYKYLNPEAVEAKVGDEDVRGSGKFHCDVCVRFFESQSVLDDHERSKAHKKAKKRQNWEDEMAAKEAESIPKRRRRSSGTGVDGDMEGTG